MDSEFSRKSLTDKCPSSEHTVTLLQIHTMAPVDWQTGRGNLECSRYMLDNEVNCDVNFKVGDDQEIIKAHKFILSMRSAVFDRMFNGSFCEADSDPVIPDVTAAAFKIMLRSV